MKSPVEIASNNKTQVWDPLVRAFHWSLAISVLANALVIEAHNIHRWVGYTCLALISLRVLWGFVGSPYARFTQFVRGPSTVFSYVLLALGPHPQRHLGHNPAGAWMMLALMTMVAALGVTGWMMGLDKYWGEEWLEELHEALSNSLLVMVLLHVAAAIIESRRHRENLIKSMITGLKRIS